MLIENLERHKKIITLLFALIGYNLSFTQMVPSEKENIDYISTFGIDAGTQWGDDDKVQIFFLLIPEDYKDPVFIRIFDPECEGQHDLATDGYFNTRTSYSVYGGFRAFTHPDARTHKIIGNYNSGNLLVSVTFSNQKEWDDKWYTLGPFNPQEGEYVRDYNGYVFKIIIEGLVGNDGNAYKLYTSRSGQQNIPIDGSNAFTYKYSFRLKNDPGQVAHLYPLIDQNVKSIIQYNFDFDHEGEIKLYSILKNGHNLKPSGDNEIQQSQHEVYEKEHGKSMDIQIAKSEVRVNDMTFYILNEYKEAIPFFAVPIGGIPKYEFKINMKQDYSNRNRSY